MCKAFSCAVYLYRINTVCLNVLSRVFSYKMKCVNFFYTPKTIFYNMISKNKSNALKLKKKLVIR